jgi:segregation and condensation protein B
VWQQDGAFDPLAGSEPGREAADATGAADDELASESASEIAGGAASDGTEVDSTTGAADGQDDDPLENGAGQDEDDSALGAFTLAGALESLLFVADEAVEPAQLGRALGIAPAMVEAALLELDAAYRRDRRGLRLQVRNGRYQLVTAPEAANLIESFLNLDASARLSAPALEALAVVAYRQPVTRTQIEAVRGVDCSGVLRSLLQRGLLEEVGRLDAPGRPVLYGVTDLFMHHFGLTALHELPPLEEAEVARLEEIGG